MAGDSEILNVTLVSAFQGARFNAIRAQVLRRRTVARDLDEAPETGAPPRASKEWLAKNKLTAEIDALGAVFTRNGTDL